MNFRSSLSATLLCTASILALSTATRAQDADNSNTSGSNIGTETVVVSGSRVIADAANSPTPLTVVTTEALLASTPSSLPEALVKLPEFEGSKNSGSTNNATINQAGSTLDLRDMGVQRTLVLLDGQRLVGTNADGTIDLDALPQTLIQRVDIVTGGASAVYGSDAVSGVVNFILDKHFNGFKAEVAGGLTTDYQDSASQKLEMVAGTDLFGGRAHVEGSFRYYHEDGVPESSRPGGHYGQDWMSIGKGTVASPFVIYPNAYNPLTAFGGKITCAGCPVNGMQFGTNATITPFDPGMTTVGTDDIGGDGTTYLYPNITSTLYEEQAFSRFSYNLDDTTTAWIQVLAGDSYTKAPFTTTQIPVATNAGPNVFFKSNAYLTPTAQALLTGGTATTFQLSEFVSDQGRYGVYSTEGRVDSETVEGGVIGTLLGKYDWNVGFTYGTTREKLNDFHNQNDQLMYASEDAVNSVVGGKNTIVCYVDTTSYASLYPGCVPMDPFGPTALTSLQFDYSHPDTFFIMTHDLVDVNGSISGEVFDLPAGPVKAALSFDGRDTSLGYTSNAPQGYVNCTGLRLCQTSALWEGNTSNIMPTKSESVWEGAAETDVPLLKDVPLIQSFNVNLAGRYTDYSASGAVESWKVGLDWHVNDDVRFRATNSIDIRAPSVNDLYAPPQSTSGGSTDYHIGQGSGPPGTVTGVGVTGTNQAVVLSNPNLVPEVARTYSAGVVFTPTFIPNLTMSLDYYKIGIKNAISSLGGGSLASEQACDATAPAYNSPFCSLVIRPLPFSNTTTSNFATSTITEALNAAFQRTEGLDAEIDYSFGMSDVPFMDTMPGSVSLRWLGNYQPYNTSQAYAPTKATATTAASPGALYVLDPTSRVRFTTFVGYGFGNWTFTLEDRWYGGFNRYTGYVNNVYANPHVGSRDYADITIDKKFMIDDAVMDGYVSVQDIAAVRDPIELAGGGLTNLYYYNYGTNDATSEYDSVGRYITVGIKARL